MPGTVVCPSLSRDFSTVFLQEHFGIYCKIISGKKTKPGGPITRILTLVLSVPAGTLPAIPSA
jgi:hypothetical protein